MHAPYVRAQIWEWETCACSGSRCANAQRGHCTRRTRAGREGVHIPCRSHIIRDGHKVATLVQELAGLAGPHEHILHRDVKDQRPSLGANLNTYLRRARGGQVTTMDVVKPGAPRVCCAPCCQAPQRGNMRATRDAERMRGVIQSSPCCPTFACRSRAESSPPALEQGQAPDPRADPDSPLRDTRLHTPARAPKLQLPFQPSARGKYAHLRAGEAPLRRPPPTCRVCRIPPAALVRPRSTLQEPRGGVTDHRSKAHQSGT
jgi:hypothetical protein